MRWRRRRRPSPEVPPAAAVNLGFLLWIVFLGAMATAGDAPGPVGARVPGAIVLRAEADGGLTADGVPLDAAGVVELARRPGVSVSVVAVPGASCEAVVGALDALRAGGVTEVWVRPERGDRMQLREEKAR